ncbi:MAG TPA: hypothetical protein VI854_07310, partial [Acidimicrobiia bacterium]|nr:hypothetical protein [Acidimicrobiia bacterium]
AHPGELKRLDRLLRQANPRRRGVPELRRMLQPFLEGRRPTESVLEDDFLALVRRFGLPEPVPQFVVGDHRLDFAYPELVTGFELQSVLAHAEKEDIQRNCTKANALVDWRIAYFTWDDVHGRPAHVVAVIQDVLRRRTLAAA